MAERDKDHEELRSFTKLLTKLNERRRRILLGTAPWMVKQTED